MAGLGKELSNDLIFFGHKNSLFGHNRFSTLFFSMKDLEGGRIRKNHPSKLHISAESISKMYKFE